MRPKSRIPETKPLVKMALMLAFGLLLGLYSLCLSPTDAALHLTLGVGMAVTAGQLITRQDSDRRGGPIAASTTLYQGTLVFTNASGYLDDDTAGGINKFAGIAIEDYDNSGGANGDISATLWDEGKFLLTGTGFAQTDVDKPAFATDNYTVVTAPTDNAVYIGVVREYVSSTKVVVELDTKEQRIKTLSESFVIGDFTDGGATSGYVDFATQLPVGALVLGWKGVTATGFTGDTTAVAQLGVSGDVDRFSALTTGSVLAAGTIGNQPADDSSAFVATAVAPRLTVTGAADFTSIAAGAITVSITYIQI